MSEMVERVAREICINVSDTPMTEEQWRVGAAENPDIAEDFRRAARAAILAMREPTEAMVAAGASANPYGRGPNEGWDAMIDEALGPREA